MRYNVSDVLKLPAGTARTYAIDAGETVALDSDSGLTVDTGHVRLSRTNRGLVARGSIRGHVDRLTCGRCLEEMVLPVMVDFEEEYLPSVDIARGIALPPPDDDLAFTIDENHHLDLSEAVRQNTLAVLPINPVCRPDCAGLCPSCGANRNNQPCRCTSATDRRPFAALAQLLPAREAGE
ncbi:MAG: hypothetical protein NVSMB65_03110 [Chloroflexota bacterium]